MQSNMDTAVAFETALRTSAHLMLAHVSVAMALFDAHTSCLLAANPAFDALLPINRQNGNALGHPLAELVPSDLSQRYSEGFRRVVETGITCHIEAPGFFMDAEKTTIWQWTLDPIAEQGQVSTVVVTVSDVTTKVQTEQMTRQAQLLDQLPEGIIVVESRAGVVRYANQVAADLVGCKLSDLIGTQLNRLASLPSSNHRQPTSRWNFALIDALWGKTVTNKEMTIVRADGSESIVLCSAVPLRVSSGLISEAIVVLQDVTGSKRLEHQRNEFFAVANHELRTPLTSILGWIELLQMTRQDEGDGGQQKAINNIVLEGEHLKRLVQDLLDVSSLEEDRFTVNRCTHELLTPLRKLVNKLAITTSTHQIHFRLDGIACTDRLVGEVDLLRLEQIVTNLLTNAIKYSPSGGDIEVGVRPQRGVQGTWQEVLLWVKDHGLGIAEYDHSMIFERFYRANTFERSSINGFGIGLYLARKLVQAHGGRIWVESNQGEGSTFFVVLPLGTIPTCERPG